MQDEHFWNLIRGRRSIRRYQERAIPRELLQECLEAASWAPSAHNRQPWRFCVVTGQGLKEALSRQMAEGWQTDLLADGRDEEEIRRRIQISHARITGAPALILPCLTLEEMDVYPDRRRADAEWTMAVQSVALACQNLLLALHQAGLAACWMCAPLFAPAAVQHALQLPVDWQPQALITVGYGAESRTQTRAPLESRLLWRE